MIYVSIIFSLKNIKIQGFAHELVAFVNCSFSFQNFESVTMSFIHFRTLRKSLTEETIKNLVGDAQALAMLESEWEVLRDDRDTVRSIFPRGDSKVVLPCNLHRLIWNAQKIFRINIHKPTDLHPAKIVEGL